MANTHYQQATYFPAWFRGLVIAAALVVLCACQSTTPVAPAPDQMLATTPRPYPVQQVQHVSRQWIEQVPTTPYDGPITPCSCAGCGPGTSPPMPPHPRDVAAVMAPPDEYLCDGGDFGIPAGVRSDWSTTGIEQEDTITHYDTLDGRVVVAPSNRVCIYAPRFGAVRRVTNLSVNHHRVGPGGIVDEMSLAAAGSTRTATTGLQQHAPAASLGDQPASLYRSRDRASGTENRVVARDLETFLSPKLDLHVMRVGIIDNGEKPRLAQAILSAHTWSSDLSAQVVIDAKGAQEVRSRTQPGQVFVLDEPDSPRIRLIKIASTAAAQLGEEVEFALRFDNIGDQTIGNVTIIDNLATRLEYVEGSQKGSVAAEFSAEPNEGGSLVLRWEITEPVKPGEGGVLTFKTRVR